MENKPNGGAVYKPFSIKDKYSIIFLLFNLYPFEPQTNINIGALAGINLLNSHVLAAHTTS
jgi:hypothetical protein